MSMSFQTMSIQVANLLRRTPPLFKIAYHLHRALQSRYTMGVVGVVINDAHEVLLVEHAFHPKIPWGLPGGWVSKHENPADTVRRELMEELSLTVVDTQLLSISTHNIHSDHLDIAYLCRTEGEVGALSYELLAYRWYAPDDLPRLHRFQYDAIERAYTMNQKPEGSSHDH